jgi:hypothetical protein
MAKGLHLEGPLSPVRAVFSDPTAKGQAQCLAFFV